MRTMPMIKIFGWFLILTSIWQLHTAIPNHRFYVAENAWMPMWCIQVRYLGSFLVRYLGLILGVGIACGSDLARKVMIAFSFYMLATVCFRHFYGTVIHDCTYIYKVTKYHPVSLNEWIFLSYWVHIFKDWTFSVFAIWFLSRPSIKGKFKGASL